MPSVCIQFVVQAKQGLLGNVSNLFVNIKMCYIHTSVYMEMDCMDLNSIAWESARTVRKPQQSNEANENVHSEKERSDISLIMLF